MKLGFTGDISITGIFADKLHKQEEIFSDKLLNTFKSCDNVICNLEGPTTKAPNIHSPNAHVVSPKNTLEYLSKRNLSVFNLANNHIFDCDKIGLIDTIEAITKQKRLFFGAGKNINEASNYLSITHNNIKVALIGIGQGHNALNNEMGIFGEDKLDILKKTISNARRSNDWIILNYHGGEEFTLYPMPKRKKQLIKYLNLGVDIIVSHHSHTFQGFEVYGKKTIFYSLGNFIFDIHHHSKHPNCNFSALLCIEFSKTTYKFSFEPIFINKQKGILEDCPAFLSEIKRRSNFTNYIYKWQKDCFRLAFKNYFNNSPNKPIRNFLKRYKIMKFIYYILICPLYLKYKNYRPIILSGLLYYIKNTLAFNFNELKIKNDKPNF
ncbi:MAG: hypothetical protein CMP21_00905 [Rickettsiales bacterium]|nr:hypothetical protein [Rickettsiales bacterium]|tara:strand:- start:8687 stop:9826 length:1140 start_codon:yes stop_codon:yes gene_type:complete